MFVLMMLMWIQYAKRIYKSCVSIPMSSARSIDCLPPPIVSTTCTKKYECGNNKFLRCWGFSCRSFMCKRLFENIYIDIITFVQYSDHDTNSSNNYNEAIDSDSDYNSYDELLEPYILDYNDIHIN